MLNKIQVSKINGVKQEFEIVDFCKDFKNLRVNDKSGKFIDEIVNFLTK